MEPFQANDIRLDAHDMVLMLWRYGEIAKLLEARLLCKSSAC
jgi:hypothetical protein